MIFASSTLWDDYLAVMVPLILWALAGRRGPGWRMAMAAFVVVATGLWIRLRLQVIPEYRLVPLGGVHWSSSTFADRYWREDAMGRPRPRPGSASRRGR